MRFTTTGEAIDCHYFKLTLYATGSLTLECNTSFTNEFAAIGIRELDRNFEGSFNASFTGTTSDGGTVSIDDMTMALFDFIDHEIIITAEEEDEDDSNNSKSKCVVNVETLDGNSIKFLSEIWQQKGQDLNSFPTKGKWKLEGYITLHINREVTVNYKPVNQDDTVTVSWGLTNLAFRGCERLEGRPYPDSIRIRIDRHTFLISHVNNHYQKVRQLGNTAGVDVTAIVTTEAKVSELSQVESVLKNICYLLSFATMNWVTRVLKGLDIGISRISTTLLPYFTLPFKGGCNVIYTQDRTNCQLKNFVEKVYKNYIDKKDDFELIDVIEYYISAARAHSTENQFTIAYLALNTLASTAPKYAENIGDTKLERKKIKAVEINEKKIRNILQKKQKNLPNIPDLPDGVMHTIADELAHKQILDYDKMEYLIDEFKVDFNKPTLRKTVSFRGGFMHTGMDNNDEARGHYLTTLGALERTLLTMLGWKGQTYVDKLSGYNLKILN